MNVDIFSSMVFFMLGHFKRMDPYKDGREGSRLSFCNEINGTGVDERHIYTPIRLRYRMCCASST